MANEELAQLFYRRFGNQPRLFYAPGRVNLIGEHTDYNEGFVLPFAIDSGTTVAAATRTDRRVHVHSVNQSESAEFNLDDAWTASRHVWVDYVEGMARSLENVGLRLAGADLLVQSDVPMGAGLSSSAALEISVGIAMCEISHLSVDPMTLIRSAHHAETKYVGTQSGIMDPYVSMLAKAGSCLLIDCRSLESSAIPLVLGDFAILIADTGIKHSLSSSEYNLRREECWRGFQILKRRFPDAQSLRDISLAQFLLGKDDLPFVTQKRCRHVITENQRTLKAADALLRQDLLALGVLMAESHQSLRLDFEVTIPELDLLVDRARPQEGVLGSRMTGGGFGGSTITLLKRSSVPDVERSVGRAYHDAFGAFPTFRLATPGTGARELQWRST